MDEGGSGPCVPLETAERPWVVSDFTRQKLESDKALDPSVLGLVNHSHPAAAQLLDDAVMGNSLADHQDCIPVG